MAPAYDRRMFGSRQDTVPRPLIIAGMHRSGTSMVASVLAACGIDVGSDLLPADAQNVPGYFEDAAFLEFQRRLLTRACTADDGWPDWGWCGSGHLDAQAIAAAEPEARRLVDARRAAGRPWGWKDPRTTMLLEFWAAILPDSQYVLVYRAPWDVLDSIRRSGHPAQQKDPAFGLRAWAGYNFALLRFRDALPSRCVLVAAEAVGRDVSAFVSVVDGKLGRLPSARAAAVFRPELLRRAPEGDPAIAASVRLAPQIESLYRRLEEAADLPADPRRRVSVRPSPLPPAVYREGVRASVVIPCFNQGEYLLEAVASVETVAGGHHEIVIVDDGSDDQLTPPILRHLEDRGHRVMRQPNRGLAAARNVGIRAAHGAFILPLDADNRIGPDYLRAAIARLDADPQAGVVYGDALWFGEKSGRWTMGEFDAERLFCGNFIDACAVFRKTVWDELGGYDEAMPVQGWEDWDFWLRVVRTGHWTFVYCPDVHFQYRVHAASMQARLHDAENVQRLLRYVAEKHRALFEPRFPRIWATLLGELVQLRKQSANATAELAAVKRVLAARDEEIASIKPVLDARDREIAALKAVSSARENDR